MPQFIISSQEMLSQKNDNSTLFVMIPKLPQFLLIFAISQLQH